MTYPNGQHEDAAAACKQTHGQEPPAPGHRTDRCPCILNVNESTGRLQWCPQFRYAKIMLIIPISLIPILMVLFLLSRVEVVGTSSNARHNIHNQLENPLYDATAAVDGQRCTAIRFSMTETLENEDRDLLKDIRTSFIPPDYLVAPPNCVGTLDDDSDSMENSPVDLDYGEEIRKRNELFDESGVVRKLDDLYNIRNTRYGSRYEDYYYRRRRETLAQQHNESALVELVSNIDDDDETAILQENVVEFSARPIEGTPDLIRSTQAQIMLHYMDDTVDPCDDFYQYACGNWAKLNTIPKDKAAYDTFEMLRENLDEVLKELLLSRKDSPPKNTQQSDRIIESVMRDIQNTLDSRKKSRLRRRIMRKRSVLREVLERFVDERPKRVARHTAEGEDSAEEKAQKLFKSCMDYEMLESRGIAPLLDFLNALGGWPALDANWSDEGFDWLNLTATLKQFNNDILIVEWVGADIKNSNMNVIQFDQTTFGLPTRDYFLNPNNEKYLIAYKVFMRTIIQILGRNEDEAEEVATEIVAFETELAKITSAPEQRLNVSILYNKMTVNELGKKIPGIDWKRYLSIVQQREVNSSETLVMYAVDYMKNLVTLISESSSKDIANYLLWRFVRHRINNLDDRFQDAKQKFYFVLFGREQSPLRWKTCVAHVNSNMGMAVGAMFVRKYFDENSKKDTLDMTYELQQSFREILNTTEWLDAPTRHFAEMKVNAMTLRIGYPDFILDQKELNSQFSNLTIEPDRYFENSLRVLRHISKSEQSKLSETVNRTAWYTAPAVVNAYYSRNKNQIMFPAGILQPPFYHRHFPKALNYGGIGVVIGHELTHGFDDKGRLFDMEGNMWRWWSDAAIEGFHKRAKCLVAQYGNYTVAEVNVAVDGENTQGENIADNGGIKQAYRAYTQWLKSHRLDEEAMRNELLPGVNATSTQLFFLNFAQVWCGSMRPEATRSKLKTAVHSPGRFRVIGTLSNSEEFAREFQCPLGSPMNPENKCRVW